MKQAKFLLSILIVIPLVFFLYRFCHHQTDGFAVRKIRTSFLDHTIPHLSSSFSEQEKTEVKKILSQPLTYIGRGGQCYAFATADDKYVVKLLKYNNNYPRIWFRLFPFPLKLELYRQEQISKKQKKLEGEYRSYQIALKDLQQETGIFYVHLDKGSLPSDIQLEIFDKINMHYVLSADAFQFYIQKKGTPFYPGFRKMIQESRFEEAKKALDELSSYLIKRCQKKITDKDKGIWRNFAFHQEHPFQIDIGQFIYDPTLLSENAYQQNLLLFTKDFRNWLETLNPSLADYFTQKLTFSN